MKLPFAWDPSPGRDYQGTVIAVGVETVDVKTGATILTNVQVAAPLEAEDIETFDVVALTWSNSRPYVTSILGHKTGLKRDKLKDTTPPAPPANVRVVQTTYGARLEWNFGGRYAQHSDFAFYEVDARQPGGAWGYDAYPVNEGTRNLHYPRLPQEPVQCRVRAEDVRGNRSAWVVCDTLLQDSVAPPAPTGFSVSDATEGVHCAWNGPVPGEIPDLAGFNLYQADDSNGTGAHVVKTVGPTLRTFYNMYPGFSKYFNLTAFDQSGNESGYAESTWVLGRSFIGSGFNWLTNADFERDLDGNAMPDEWGTSQIIPWVKAASSYGNYGREGGKGVRFTMDDDEATTLWWPNPFDRWPASAIVGQYYCATIYLKTAIDPSLWAFGESEEDGKLCIDCSVSYTDGSTVLSDPDSFDDSWMVQTLGSNWYRLSNVHETVAADVTGGKDFLGFTFYVLNRTGGTITVDIDRPKLEEGRTPSAWSPGIMLPGGASDVGLAFDASGLITRDGTLGIGRDGKFHATLQRKVGGTVDIGTTGNPWNTTYTNQVQAPEESLYVVAGEAKDIIFQGVVGDWWDPNGEGLPVWAAYRAIGASSLAASYVDVSGNNHDVSPGAAPGFSPTYGWDFTGTQFLLTGFVPDVDGSQTILVQFSDIAGGSSDVRVLARMWNRTGADFSFGMCPHWGTTRYYWNGLHNYTTGTYISGNMAVAGDQGYYNGSPDLSTITGSSVDPVYQVYIGATNREGTAVHFLVGRIQAVAIYDDVLTPSQVASVAAAMAALTSSQESPDRMIIKSTGKVGIGTTAPVTRLDLADGALRFTEMTSPDAPWSNAVVIFARDNAGKTELCARFATGAIQQLAIEP